MYNEDPVRLALLCQTVAKLFDKNGDENNYTDLRIWGFGATPGGGGVYSNYIILYFFTGKPLNIF